MEIFQPQTPELTEKQKTLMSLEDFSYNSEKVCRVLKSLVELLSNDLLTTLECQQKADVCIEHFIDYVNKGGEGY